MNALIIPDEVQRMRPEQRFNFVERLCILSDGGDLTEEMYAIALLQVRQENEKLKPHDPLQ